MIVRTLALSTSVIFSTCSSSGAPYLGAGEADEAAEAACASLSQSGTSLDAADGAAGATVHTRASHLGIYTISLPEEEAGFVALNIDVGGSDWAVFTEGDVSLVAGTFEDTSFAIPAGVSSDACPGEAMLDRRFHFDEAGDHVLQFAASGDRVVWLNLRRIVD